jgi:hypothetical protein
LKGVFAVNEAYSSVVKEYFDRYAQSMKAMLSDNRPLDVGRNMAADLMKKANENDDGVNWTDPIYERT